MDIRLPQRPYRRYRHFQYNSYDPLAQVHNHTIAEGESKQEIQYFHCDQIGIPREMTDKDGNLVWFGDYYDWGRLKEETKVTDSAYRPFRLQNQYADRETGLHYNFFRYYEPDAGRFVNQDPIRLVGDAFAPNTQDWLDLLGLCSNSKLPNADKAIIDPRKITGYALNTEHPVGGKSKGFSICIRI